MSKIRSVRVPPNELVLWTMLIVATGLAVHWKTYAQSAPSVRLRSQ